MRNKTVVMSVAALFATPMVQGLRFAARRFARGGQARLRPQQRPRGLVAMRLGGGAFEFPSSDRWRAHLMEEDGEETTSVLVLQKEDYDAWLANQTDEGKAYVEAAGLAKFKDDALVLLPERRWAFLTKDASGCGRGCRGRGPTPSSRRGRCPRPRR